MGRDHSETCPTCGFERGGLNDVLCACEFQWAHVLRAEHDRLAARVKELEAERDTLRRLATKACDLAHERTTLLGDGWYGPINAIRNDLAKGDHGNPPPIKDQAYFMGYADGKRTAQWTDTERDSLRAEVERMRPVYDLALAWQRAGHVDDANHAAGDCDDCPARPAKERLIAAIDAALTKESPPDDESRCAVCGWPLSKTVSEGCVRGNCSHRPRPEHLYAPDRAAREALSKESP